MLESTTAEDLEHAGLDEMDNNSDSSTFMVTTGKVPLRLGMLFWIATHRGCYFWVRSMFQIVAYSFLIVTLVMLNEF